MKFQADLELNSPALHSTHSACKGLRLAVISDAAPARNGVGAYYQDLLEQLSRPLAAVKMFSPTLENGRWSAGIVMPLPGDATQKLCMPNPRRLRRELKAFKPDVVIVATPGPYGLLGAYLAGRLKLPALAGFHTSFEQLTELYWKGSWTGRAIHELFRRSHSYLFRKSQCVLANSSAMIELAERMGAPRAALIGTPVSAGFVEAPRRVYNGDFSRVLFAGRLAAEKNLEAVLAAVADCPEIEFSIAGDGPQRALVEQAAQRHPNLNYLGWLDRSALREQVDHHHALLLPSHFESFGTIALEAMARGRLVVVSPGCGITQWPSLRSGLCVMDEGEAVSSTLSRLASMSKAQRQIRATHALSASLDLNERCINHWCELLVQTASETPVLSDFPFGKAAGKVGAVEL